jgi:hypothetical protein
LKNANPAEDSDSFDSRIDKVHYLTGIQRMDSNAHKFGVDPSYVSRVARGERRPPKIEVFLDREILRIQTAIKAKSQSEEED